MKKTFLTILLAAILPIGHIAEITDGDDPDAETSQP